METEIHPKIMNLERKAFSYNGEILHFEILSYHSGEPAIIITDVKGQRYCTLSVHIPEVKKEPGEFCVKNWSENEAIANHLAKSGLFEETGRGVATGFVTAPIWRVK